MTNETKRVRIEVLTEMVELMERVAKLDDRSTSSVFRELTRLIFEALQKSNATIKLTPSWALAWEAMQHEITDGSMQRDSDAIDLSVLHTSRTTNSGFEGVYLHSNPARGFFAHGRDPETKKPGKYLGLFSTAPQAAWARYQHYKKHGMPYGKLEEEIEKVRNNPHFRITNPSERWIRQMAIWCLAQRGIILPDLPPKERIFENQVPEFD